MDTSSIYDSLLDLLSEHADVSRLQSFRLSEAEQIRLDGLLEKNRDGTLSDRDRAELETFEDVEHLVRLLKAKLLQKNGS